jgi:ring-1,2-phenylacetyl-CoA epoxidase subunit PaaC
MTRDHGRSLAAYLLALADDELILGHRNSEWCGHAPILEEDIAFANLAQDELGHAALWYRLVETLTGQPADQLVFFRDAADYGCAPFVELPKGDWAFSMLRQYLFDAAEAVRLPLLAQSEFAPLAETAAKIRTEEIYHLRHTRAWIRRLGLGTEESHRRTQAALNGLWPYALQLLALGPSAPDLSAAHAVPTAVAVQSAWEAEVRPFLAAAGLVVPDAPSPIQPNRTNHTTHLGSLLADMQSVARLEPEGVTW